MSSNMAAFSNKVLHNGLTDPAVEHFPAKQTTPDYRSAQR